MCILQYGYSLGPAGIMGLWLYGSKKRSGWSGRKVSIGPLDTAFTSRAPEVLKVVKAESVLPPKYVLNWAFFDNHNVGDCCSFVKWPGLTYPQPPCLTSLLQELAQTPVYRRPLLPSSQSCKYSSRLLCEKIQFIAKRSWFFFICKNLAAQNTE